MKEKLREFVKTYCLFVCIFLLQKPLFMRYYQLQYTETSWVDWLSVVWHGLQLDLSLAGYLMIIPCLIFIATIWTTSKIIHYIRCSYFFLVSIVLSFILIIDLGLYQYWGFRLDATPLFYFGSSPQDALASVSTWTILGGIVAMIVYSGVLYGIFHFLLLRKNHLQSIKLPFQRFIESSVLLLLTLLLFIPIRGGFSVSTMNVGKVYFSSNQKLNHAAINPMFSLLESLSRQNDFSNQYRFFEASQADTIFRTMVDPSILEEYTEVKKADSLPKTTSASRSLFNTQRPNFIFVILESFSSRLMSSLGGKEEAVAVQLDSLSAEGILFTNFYANSFRTDRGLVSILSGYPAQPSTSIMKYPRKTQNLPSIANSLKKEGYETKYYYGGDADFTNMRSYLISTGFDEIISDQDFSASERLGKWGVHDHLVFDRLLRDLKAAESASPSSDFSFRVIQTSSSHEPFEVPYDKLDNDRLNAFAYTDSCAGSFVRQFREMSQWKNTVIVFVPDHFCINPEQLDNPSTQHYNIPLLMVGGAVRAPSQIDVYGSQHDIAATLLSQLALPHNEFTFSKDMLDPDSPHFAFFTIPDVFGMITAENQMIFNCQADAVVLDEGTDKSKNIQLGKVYLQKLYDDISNL